MGGLSFMNKMNLVYWMPTYRTWVAEAQLAVGDLAGAERSLSEALAVVERGDERWFESECWRVQSRIEIARGLGTDQVLRTLERSLAAATANGSRSFELRTALDLHRLLQAPNEGAWHQSSRELLQRCLAAFGTGPQLADQREAAVILATEAVPR